MIPDISAGKESTCNAGDPSLIPRSGRSAAEGIGYPLQCSWASLVAQLVENQPAMRETWLRSLGWEDPLEKGKATHSSILAWRIPWTIWSMGSQRVEHFHFQSIDNWIQTKHECIRSKVNNDYEYGYYTATGSMVIKIQYIYLLRKYSWKNTH